jgi:zinc/manganese transport system substrate-binding protein
MLCRRFVLQVLAVLAVLGPLALPAAGYADPPVKAVATFSILGDMLREVGGERVEVTTLVGANGDAHVYQPTPADARAVAGARVVLVNGLGYEGWIDRLISSSGFGGSVIIVSAGVSPLTMPEGHDEENGGGHGHSTLDPHAWQSLRNGATYVRNIAQGLIAADPEGAAVYAANADRYAAELAALDAEVRTAFSALPADRRTIVTSHDAFGYFGAAYGMRVLAPEGVSTEAEASAKDVARLIRQIRAEKIPAVFVETITDPRLIERIRKETGAVVGGTLYSDALSAPDGPAPTYLQMFRYNTKTLIAALSP